MPVIGGLIGGKLPTQQQLLAQVNAAIGANLALGQIAPVGFTFDPQASIRPQPGATPFIGSIIPQVGGGPPAGGGPSAQARCECVKLTNIAAATKISRQRFTLTIGANGTEVLGNNSRRIAAIFFLASNTTALLDTSQILASSQHGVASLTGNAAKEYLVKDFGALVTGQWFAINAGGVGGVLDVTQIVCL